MTKVFKFGGASVKDADSVRNVASILKQHAPEKLVVIVSAMGKMTNALEKVLNAWYENDERMPAFVQEMIAYHSEIINELFADKKHPVYFKTDLLFGELEGQLSSPPSLNYDFDYDQIVCFGELISTVIVSEFLVQEGFNCQWFDVRELVRTDNNWREGKVDWETTGKMVEQNIVNFLNADVNHSAIALTQGFLGSTVEGATTTLGREGSDYTASIFSYLLNAEEMTVWKDVPGVLNADPKYFEDTKLLNHISYREAIELTYYGASVIHPKTIKPLQNKAIPLRVKSFLQPEATGTLIGPDSKDDSVYASVILKSKQVLASFSPKDFSFIAEDNLSEIFAALAASGIRANMMQTSALSFTVCMDENHRKMQRLFSTLDRKFSFRYNEGLQLITIRHYDPLHIERMLAGKELLVEQRSRTTAQFVIKESIYPL